MLFWSDYIIQSKLNLILEVDKDEISCHGKKQIDFQTWFSDVNK